MLISYSSTQLDALKELGNIGSGNAATSMATMLNTPIDLNVTELSFKSPADFDSDPDNNYSIIHGVIGSVRGFVWLSMSEEECKYICNLMTGGMDMDPSLVVGEVSNILCGGYLGAIGNMLSLNWDMEPPKFMKLQEYLDHVNLTIDKEGILAIQNKLIIEGREIECRINLVLEEPSLSTLLAACGL